VTVLAAIPATAPEIKSFHLKKYINYSIKSTFYRIIMMVFGHLSPLSPMNSKDKNGKPPATKKGNLLLYYYFLTLIF
jgi:hypothetical protein